MTRSCENLLLCLQRQLVLLSLFDVNCAQIINTSAGQLLGIPTSVLFPKQSSNLLPLLSCIGSIHTEELIAHMLILFSIDLHNTKLV